MKIKVKEFLNEYSSKREEGDFMDINNIKGAYNGYLNSLSMMNSEVKRESTEKAILKNPIKGKDNIDISSSRKKLPIIGGVSGAGVDKGTAAHTTLYVDQGTFNQIMNYSTNNPDAEWDELGIDDEKRWIVINGQRFEYPLSKEEKEARKRLNKGLIEILDELDEKRAKYKSKDEIHNSIKLELDKDNKININSDENVESNSKIKNLLSNDKVMKMLTNIIKANGGNSINISL